MNSFKYSVTWLPLNPNLDQWVGLSHCPGKISFNEGSQNRLKNDLRVLQDLDVSCLVTLVTKQELLNLKMRDFNKSVRIEGFKHYVEPIMDMSAPTGRASIDMIGNLISDILSEVQSNKKVVIHCNYGLGRTGMVAGLLLKKMGLITEPIEHIRKYRPGSIETYEQATFINNF